MTRQCGNSWRLGGTCRAAVALAIALSAGIASAEPVNKGRIAADATWYLHLDAEAALDSSLGRYVVQNRTRLGLDGLEGLRALGIDPFTDIKGITIYDTDDRDEHAVIVATTSAAVDQLVDMLKRDPNTFVMTVDGNDLVAFDDKGKTQYWHVRPGDAPDARIVFMSDDVRVVTNAMRVADSKLSSLAKIGAGSPLAGDPGSGSILFARAVELPRNVKDNPDPNASALLQQVSGVQVDIGERSGEVYADALVYTGSAEDASNIAQVGQGFIALGRMFTKNNPDLGPVGTVLGALQVEPRDRAVRVVFRLQAQKVVDAVEAFVTEKEKQRDRDGQKEARP